MRFELTDPFEPTVFKTVAIDRSAKLPLKSESHEIEYRASERGNFVVVVVMAGLEPAAKAL